MPLSVRSGGVSLLSAIIAPLVRSPATQLGTATLHIPPANLPLGVVSVPPIPFLSVRKE